MNTAEVQDRGVLPVNIKRGVTKTDEEVYSHMGANQILKT